MQLFTLADLLQQMSRLGGREAIRDSTGYRTRSLSYRELHTRIAECAEFFSGKGIGRGDRLVLWAESCAEWVVAFWAAAALGVEVVPLEARFSAGFVDAVARETGAVLVLADEGRETSEIAQTALRLNELPLSGQGGEMPQHRIEPEDVLEIIYTSGTTGRPKGVVHRHRNICADLAPIAREMSKYTPFLRPVQPLRILNLLPLSHMFGQALGLFIPVLLGGSAVFSRELAPGRVLETVRRERVTALVAVPRMIRQLKEHLEQWYELPHADRVRKYATSRPLFRIWRYRRIHSRLGWRFWALVVGGAELSDDVEAWWRGLGYLPVQGYGLTEASPIVALNHPFRSRHGSLGTLLEGQEVRIAEDGELLLRGENISREYFGSETSGDADDEGWLHTGDIVERDEAGRLFYRGRKKDVIVTADGVNVHPEDVEPIVGRTAGIRDSAVVGARGPDGEPRVHAVILPESGEGPDTNWVLRETNRQLEAHQRLSGVSVWPGDDFPRTPSTQKILRREVARWVERGEREPSREEGETETSALRSALSRLTGLSAKSITPETDLVRDLGLSSLDLVELGSLLESGYGLDADAALLSGDMRVGRLEQALREGDTKQGRAGGTAQAGSGPEARDETDAGRETPRSLTYRPPRWARNPALRWGRAAFQEALVLPAFRVYTRFRVHGRENLEGQRPPVILAANHGSHMDTVAVLASLPASWRRRLAPSMQLEFFHPHFFPGGQPLWRRAWSSFQYAVACGVMNGFPLPVRSGGLKGAFRYAGELADSGYCPLIFPEGIMTPDGEIYPFRPGVAMLAERLRLPVVPVALSGLFEAFPYTARLPRPGRVSARIGRPLVYRGEEYAEFASRVEDSVVRLRQGEGD